MAQSPYLHSLRRLSRRCAKLLKHTSYLVYNLPYISVNIPANLRAKFYFCRNLKLVISICTFLISFNYPTGCGCWCRHLLRYIRYDSGYLTCSKKLTGSQLSLPHGTNKKLECETKNKMMSIIGPVQSRYREAVQ